LHSIPVKSSLKSIISLFKYIITAISYGVIFAIVLLLIVPEINNNQSLLALLQSTPQQQPISYAKAVSIAGPAVVNIYSTELQHPPIYGRKAVKSARLGSGVIMDALGYIVTNYHVVHNTDLIKVVLQSGKIYSAELIGFDIHTDLAVLKVDAINLPVIPQRTNLTSLAGDVVLAIGNPLNLGQTVTQGIISATGRTGLSNTSYLDFLQMDAAINDGNSGGALINTHGELVGINSRQVTDDKLNIQGIFLAVPYQLAAKVMQKIIANGRVVRGWLGIEADTQHAGIKGFIINSIVPDSPAKKAGLLEGDIIYQIGEHTIVSIGQALDLVAETVPNTTLAFKIYRKKESLDIPVTIVEMKK
jgi:serine protease DegS|tara:strand:- start:109 stop:1188 length:1080 start_codon:yes stop_codon:yes gene_type:complete